MSLLSTLREDCFVERMGLESRLDDVTAELATFDARTEADLPAAITDVAPRQAARDLPACGEAREGAPGSP